jgi:hypothetical protein
MSAAAHTAVTTSASCSRPDDLAGAEAAYRRGDERGHATAANNRGEILRQRGDGRKPSRRTDGRTSAATPLVASTYAARAHYGDTKGAEAAYRRADERCSGEGAYALMFRQRGEREEAHPAARRARDRDIAGNPRIPF